MTRKKRIKRKIKRLKKKLKQIENAQKTNEVPTAEDLRLSPSPDNRDTLHRMLTDADQDKYVSLFGWWGR